MYDYNTANHLMYVIEFCQCVYIEVRAAGVGSGRGPIDRDYHPVCAAAAAAAVAAGRCTYKKESSYKFERSGRVANNNVCFTQPRLVLPRGI